MKKRLILIATFLIICIGISLNRTRNVFAESCGITANMGTSTGGNSFHINTRINTDGLDKNSQYILSENLSGTTGHPIACTFTPNSTGDQQCSFDISGSKGAVVNLTVTNQSSGFGILCTSQVVLQSTTSPNTNDNLPDHPGNIEVQCNNGSGINTAIGCIPITDQNALIGFFLKWALGIGGGIAFLLILVAGFQIMTSRGDPNRLKAGQELMTSAIAGILLLIFSLVILRIIGVDLLKIPGFTS
jgi:hypothetical protein